MEPNKSFFTKKNIITSVLVLVVILSIPVGVFLVQRQQELRSRASGPDRDDTSGVVTFSGSGVTCDSSGGNCTTSEKNVEVVVNPPFGAAVGAAALTGTLTPTPTRIPPASTSTPTPTP